MVSALILVGSPGAGKSSVRKALGTQLELRGIPYGAIESEQLALGSPWLEAEHWLEQLAMVLRYQRGAGRTLFLVAATVESSAELVALVRATGADRTTVVCLISPPDLVAARIEEREPDHWPGRAALAAHARDLATTIPSFEGIDLSISTEGRDAVDVAVEIFDYLDAEWALLGSNQ